MTKISYKDKVYNHIKHLIIAFEAKPGDAINESVIAEQLHVSRTPVREAIQKLTAEGWISIQPWKGAIVQPVTAGDIEDLMLLRMVLEPTCVEILGPKLEKMVITHLEGFLARQNALASSTMGGNEFIRIDQEFHAYLAELSGSKHMQQFLAHLRDAQLRLGVAAVQSQPRIRKTLQEHEEIINCLRKRDCFAAKQALIYHLIQTRRALIHYLDTKIKESA